MAKSKKKKAAKKSKKIKKAVKKTKKIKKSVRKKAPKKQKKKASKKPAAKKAAPRQTATPATPKVIPLPPPATPVVPRVSIEVGQMAPDFRVKDDTGSSVSLSSYRGKKVVLYFYPKDDTPGCTIEACSFRDGAASLYDRGSVVLGVSPDPVESHQKFKQKHSLNFPLLADTGQEIAKTYGVWKEKSMYGKTYMGIERTTFVIDEYGRIAKIFPKVSPDGHLQEVLGAL